MLRVTSLNVNGIRAAFRKGLPAWLEAQKPHIVCMQEIKISEPDLTPDLTNPGQPLTMLHATSVPTGPQNVGDLE